MAATNVVAHIVVMTSVYAQAPPDAGAVRQQVERQREPQEPKPSASTPTTDKPAGEGAASPMVTINEFRFTGNRLLSNETLNASLQEYLRRPLTFEELQKAVASVGDAYRKAGWIVRAYLPMQDIKDGAVTVAIVEAKYGETRLEGGPPKRVPFERLEPILSKRQAKGAPLKAAALDRALLLINDLPGITASGHLAAGAQEGETDLILKVQDDAVFTGEAVVDNTGSRSTGELREIVTANLNSPFHRGEQFGATLLHSEGVNYLHALGTMPLGKNGWRVGAHASHLQYDVVSNEFAALDIEGTSTDFGLDTTYALVRSRAQNLSLSVGIDRSKFDNESNGITTSSYAISAVDVSVHGYRFDSVAGGGINVGSLAVVYGKADLSDSPNQAIDAITTNVDGGFTKVNFFVSRQQYITETISAYGSVSGQFASSNLDSSEKFYLGGVAGVRAYPASEAGGDEGLLATLEGRMRLPFGLNATVFYDWGQVTVNSDNNFVGAATLNSYSLQGAGTSLSWTSSFGLNVKATWAHRFGDNPRASPTGTDQDGTLKKGRLWLQASLSF